MRHLKAGNARLLGWAFAHQKALFAMVAIGVLAAGFGSTQLPRAFLPPFNEGTILINLQYNPGISLGESSRLAGIAERLILDIPEVKSVGRRTGRAELDEHAEGVHNSEIDVDLARSSRTKEEVYAHIRTKLAVLPVSVSIGQPIAHRLEHMLSGVQAQIVVKLFGEDLDTLRSQAEALRARLEPIPGVVDLRVEKQVLIPQLRVTPDYERAALYGITPAALTEALEALANGRVVSQIVDGNRRFDVVMRALGRARSTTGLQDPAGVHAQGLRALLGCSPPSRRARAPTRSCARTAAPHRRIGQRRRQARHGGHRRRHPPRHRRHAAAVRLHRRPARHLPGAGGGALVIGLLSLVSLALIFTVLYQRYQSVVLAAIILTSIPLALIGSVAALGLAGQPLSVASMIGFITLAGIAARNGILKISHYINLALFEGERFGPALVVRGSLERLSPVLMTALCAGLALVPLLLAPASRAARSCTPSR